MIFIFIITINLIDLHELRFIFILSNLFIQFFSSNQNLQCYTSKNKIIKYDIIKIFRLNFIYINR